MPEVIAGVAVPDTPAAVEATRVVRQMTSPLIFHHSCRVFLFGAMDARERSVQIDPELLYLAALFHDTGLATPFSELVQRFELDGADHARTFLLDREFPAESVEVVWTAIALHTTPGVPARMGPEIAALARGVLTDVVGLGLAEIDRDHVSEVLEAHPRGDFKNNFLRAYSDGLAHRPDTTYGTVNGDVLERFVPTFHRTNMVDRVMRSPWPT
jgi:hypothetical protein